MTIVALTLSAVLLVAVLSFASVVRSMIRQQARERDLLLNQMMNLAGRPWQQPPAPEPEPVEDQGRYVLTPESLPDY